MTSAAAIGVVRVIKRDGTTVDFEAAKIRAALTKAFIAVNGTASTGSSKVHQQIETLTTTVMHEVGSRHGQGRAIHVEEIQDLVELALMRSGEHAVARAYVVYRTDHARAREATPMTATAAALENLRVTVNGMAVPIDSAQIMGLLQEACRGLDRVDPNRILTEASRSFYQNMPVDEITVALMLAARSLVEAHPDYSYASARLLLSQLRQEVLHTVMGTSEYVSATDMGRCYGDYFTHYVRFGIEAGRLDPRLADFDLERLGRALDPERDLAFTQLGLQTLYDRYLLSRDGRRFELPQALFMRVAMGLAIDEDDPEGRAIEFYAALSNFDLMTSTPTLFNAGTVRPQLSSCFLTTVPDDLGGIFSALRDNALLAKYSGGLGNDWTPVRGTGALIHGTNGKSSGVVPFLKIANDTALAVNQGGKRKGATCAYLETWHIDIAEFCDLRKNTGDDRRRTHDMNTAHWIPDLFLQRVEADESWTLFSPDEVPDLHDLYGAEFAQRYQHYEAEAHAGRIKVHQTVRAVTLWRRMLTMLFETGHPWITFKDACNVRSPQQHVGVIHSSNLCTEITLNTSVDEVAVCNLASINLVNHVNADGIDREHLARTVNTAVRMLDNVIDLNLYTISQAEHANKRHRPVGLGLMGFADSLARQHIPYASEAAVEFADRSMELISWHALEASAALAAERGSYASFPGSLWEQGILPIDSVTLLARARGGDLEQDTSSTLDWDSLRERVRAGMRNSNVMAIAPTATISNIVGVSQSIEPLYRNLFVKSNMSGDFTVLNAQLVEDLSERGLWDQAMVSDLKYFDGLLGPIDRVPDELKKRYATAFEIDPHWLVRCASRRQKWIDQAQSLNLYVAQPNGRALDEHYRYAWRTGCKTTYYLRSQSATHVEKSTLIGTDGRLNAVIAPSPATATPSEGAACSLTDPDCEACQ